MIIAPSVLSLNYEDTKQQLAQLKASQAQWLHFDVMDGHFVPNLTFGPDILKAFKKATDLFMDVHIMVDDPKKVAPWFVEAGADCVTFHLETLEHPEEIQALAAFLHEAGIKAGISIKPKTPVETLFAVLPYFDLVLVMSVEPGFGGQAFDPQAPSRIAQIKEAIVAQQLNCLIEVDGGVNDQTAPLCKEAGADVLVAGSYIFKHDIIQAVASLC